MLLVDAIDAVHSTYRPEVISDIGLWRLFCCREGYGRLISGTDGVGTKLKIASSLTNDPVGIILWQCA
ncbi:MAG: hypothetical protein ACLTQI_07715 [Slackia sp.]